MKRRTILLGSTILLAQALSACQRSTASAVQIRLLERSIPAPLLREFQRRQGKGVDLSLLPSSELADLFKLLQTWKNPEAKPSGFFGLAPRKPPTVASLITLGDYWLTAAIQQGLIQPLDLKAVPEWTKLSPHWQTLVQRDRQGNLDPNGQIWAAPYRVGTLMMAYQVEKFKALGWTPTDWSDLWRPELKGHISLPNSPRSVIGIGLKTVQQSVNQTDLTTVPRLRQQLRSLHQQVKFYDSDAYIQPLVLEDTWLAVGWSTELLPTVERNPSLAAAVPKSGTILTADLWVRPASAPALADPALLNDWIGFYWQPRIATQLSLLSSAVSPLLAQSDRSQLAPALQQNPLRLPPQSVLDASEFLLPLPEASRAQYQQEWVTMRQG